MNISPNIYRDELARIGQALRSAREQIRMSQEMVAEQLGVTTSTIGKIERGQWNVSVGYLIALSKIYGCRLTFVWPGDQIVSDVAFE